MSNVVRNVLAFLAGLVVGGVVNMAIVMVSGSVIPPPPGADVTTVEGLKASIHLFEPKHFAMPFLAHALGTLAGAALAALLAASHRMKLAIGIGTLNLIGGIAAAAMIPAPGWFIGLDLVAAYLPMAWIGGKLARRT